MPSNISFHADDLSQFDLDDLRRAGHWQARYKLLLRWGDSLSEKPAIHGDLYRVKGCDTALWLAHWYQSGRHWFAADGASRVVKGLTALVLSQVQGRSHAEIEALNLLHLLDELGLASHLTPSRANGFRALVLRVRELAGDTITQNRSSV